MKTLTAPAALVAGRRWAAPVFLAQIDFTIPTPFTLRVSDAPRNAAGFDWHPLVADWGNVEAVLNTLDLGGRPGTAELGLFNARPVPGTGRARLSDTIRSPFNAAAGAYEWAYARVAIAQLLDAAHGSADAIVLGVFYLEDPVQIDERILRVRMVDASLALEDKLDLTRVTRLSFPAADPDAIGRAIPVPIGVVPNAPTLAIVAGGQSTLAANTSDSSPAPGGVLAISDVDAFPGSGVVQVDDEQMSYSAKTSTGVVVAARAVNGTAAAAHSSGATVWEVRSGPRAYRYLVGENRGPYKIHAVANVKAGGVLQPGATVDYDDTTLMPGRSFVVVNFPALPVVKKQVLVDVVDTIGVADGIGVIDTIDVDDTIGVADGIYVSDGIGVSDGIYVADGIGVSDGIGVADNISVSSPSRTTLSRIQTTTGVTCTATVSGSASASFNSGAVTVAMPATLPAGVIYNVNRKMSYRVTQSGIATSAWAIYRSTPGGGFTPMESGSSFPAVGARTLAWSSGTIYGDEQIAIAGTGAGPGSIQVVVDSLEQTVEMGITVAKSGSAYRSGAASKTGTASKGGTASKTGSASKGGTASKTGAADKSGNAAKAGTVAKTGTVEVVGNSTADVVIGDVTCDVAGVQDDAAGTITGTPYTLLQNPADVVKFVLLAMYPGITTADFGSTWAATRAALAGAKWAALLDYARFSELRAAFGMQARSVLYLEAGRWEFKLIPDRPEAALVLDYARDVWAEQPALVSRTPLTELRNSLWVYSARDYRREGDLEARYARASNVKDTANTFPETITESLELSLVQDEVTAVALGEFHLTRAKRQRFMVSLVAWWNAVGLEQADFVAISGHPVLDNHGGVDLVFQVVTRRYTDGGRIALELAQMPVVPTEARMLLPVPGSQLSSDVVLFDWTEGFDVSAYMLHVGSAPGASDYYASGVIPLGTTAASVTLPSFTSPGTVYVRLWSQIAGVWLANDYAYSRYYVLTGSGAYRTPMVRLAGLGRYVVGSSAYVAPMVRLAGLAGAEITGTAAFVAPCGQARGGDRYWIPPLTDLYWEPPDGDLFWTGLGIDRFIAPVPRLAGVGGPTITATGGVVIGGPRLWGTNAGGAALYWTGLDGDLYWTGADSDLYW